MWAVGLRAWRLFSVLYHVGLSIMATVGEREGKRETMCMRVHESTKEEKSIREER